MVIFIEYTIRYQQQLSIHKYSLHQFISQVFIYYIICKKVTLNKAINSTDCLAINIILHAFYKIIHFVLAIESVGKAVKASHIMSLLLGVKLLGKSNYSDIKKHFS